MSRAVASFKKRDIATAYKAVIDAGGEVSRIEVDRDGRIVIVIGKPTEQAGSEATALDAWKAKHAR
jgi:hypothetical protein